MQINRQTLLTIRGLLPSAIGAAVVLIVVGLVLAWALKKMGTAPPSVALATSPGALAAMTAAALAQGVGAVEVAMFHLVRLVLTILSLPLLLWFLD